jgi:hypothetical protein
MAHDGHMEKFVYDRAMHSTYEFDTPSGIKKVKYSDLEIYIPLKVYEANEKKERTRAADYKEHKTLDEYQYGHLVKYFPDEKDKWNRVKETKFTSGRFGMPEEEVIIKYERTSQGGGRRKKVSRKAKRRAKSTRRR